MTKRAPRPSVLLNWIGIDRRSDVALYRQIGNQIRDAILAGDIEPGAYVPASRALAADLGVSRITTLQAYEQLISERFLETRRGSGTRVAPALAEQPLPKRADAHEPFQAPHLQEFYDVEPQNVEFQPGIPSFDAFPRGRWSRLLQRHGARKDQHLLDYAHIGGYAPLRQEIANYLNGSRGVTCSPEQVIVVASTRAAVGAVCSVLWRHGSEVMVEDPGYRVIQRVLIAAGMRLRHVPVDAKGIRTDQLSHDARGCVGAYLTPAQQWPTGRTLVAERRVRLLDWAKRTGAWIVEDDYDSEFRFDSPPVAPLHSFGSGRVVLVGTFSKTLVPSLRTAYMVVPADMVTQFERAVFQNGSEPPLHVQAALAEFLAEGDYTRHIARMRKLYARRRARLVQALEEVFGGVLAVTCPPGGLQVIAQLPEGVAAEEITRRAAGIGIVARPMSVYHTNV
jgi:GntR family transcriptional regulator/MocR family aminotransferase